MIDLIFKTNRRCFIRFDSLCWKWILKNYTPLELKTILNHPADQPIIKLGEDDLARTWKTVSGASANKQRHGSRSPPRYKNHRSENHGGKSQSPCMLWRAFVSCLPVLLGFKSCSGMNSLLLLTGLS